MLGLNGFDTHDNLLATHNSLVNKLGDGLANFYEALEEIGMTNQAATFTASDFGHAYTSNGDGSDHG